MISEKKYKTLIWLVTILIAINLSTVVSLLYHTSKNNTPAVTEDVRQSDNQAENGVRQFRDYLGLNPDQVLKFREINREYNRNANQITRDLEILRIRMIDELARPETSTEKIKKINREFGGLHEQLKNLTADYYLAMKAECDDGQQQKLHELFSGMLNKEQLSHPRQGRRQGRGWSSD